MGVRIFGAWNFSRKRINRKDRLPRAARGAGSTRERIFFPTRAFYKRSEPKLAQAIAAPFVVVVVVDMT